MIAVEGDSVYIGGDRMAILDEEGKDVSLEVVQRSFELVETLFRHLDNKRQSLPVDTPDISMGVFFWLAEHNTNSTSHIAGVGR